MTQESTFNPAAFITATVDAPLDTEYWTCPEGDYEARIGDMTEDWFRQAKRKDGSLVENPRTGAPSVVFEPRFILTDAKLAAESGRDKIEIRGRGGFLDLDESGAIATGPGRNVLLGQMKAAVGQNIPGVPLSQLSGAGPLMVRVTHRSNESNPGQKFAEVTRVAPLR